VSQSARPALCAPLARLTDGIPNELCAGRVALGRSNLGSCMTGFGVGPATGTGIVVLAATSVRTDRGSGVLTPSLRLPIRPRRALDAAVLTSVHTHNGSRCCNPNACRGSFQTLESRSLPTS
jgi:hypothetical protein